MAYFKEPINHPTTPPIGLEPIAGTPIFVIDPTEPEAGFLLLESGTPILLEDGSFIGID